VFWAAFAVVSGVAFVHTVIVTLRRRWIARMTPDAIELTGMWGGVQVFRWGDLVAHTIDPANRTGVIFATSGDVARGKERFGIVSLRMMGVEAAQRFYSEMTNRRPCLANRLTHPPATGAAPDLKNEA
jgi:hypothetical protein